MAGYHNFSMSNNAVSAYEDGEKPMSKWTKEAIIREVKQLISEGCEFKFDIALFQKLGAAQCRYFLRRTSWHHTSKQFNRTDFYSIDLAALEELTAERIEAMLADAAKEKAARRAEPAPEQPKTVTRKCSYLVWGGTRKHPKATEHTADCEITGNWAMTPHGRKSITAKGFYILPAEQQA